MQEITSYTEPAFSIHVSIPALFEEALQQTWLNIQNHIECIVSLYIGQNCSEI